MNETIGYKIKEETEYAIFIDRILENKAEVITEFKERIGQGIELKTIQISSNWQKHPEEKAYLGFYPIEDEKFYLTLTFFPDLNLNDTEMPYPIIQLSFSPDFFNQWPKNILNCQQPFSCNRSTEQAFTLPAIHRETLLNLLAEANATEQDFINTLKKQELVLQILGISLNTFQNPCEESSLPACSFLSNGTEREKVLEAKDVIMNRLDDPITIKELSKVVAINECYLKKGFKAMFGKTIHEFQQYERIEKAKSLIQKNKYTINEVAFKMGFNSHSHFSTAFKRITGIKPCELLS